MTIQYFVQADEPNKQDLETFFTNLDLILTHQNFILNDSKYSNIQIKGCGVFALYIPTFPLFVGDLLQLWAKTEWKQDDQYFYAITGSPLSGSNSSKYWSNTDGFTHKSTTTFGKQIKSAICLLRTGSMVIPDGGVSVNVPQRIASDLSISELIEVLKDCRKHSHNN